MLLEPCSLGFAALTFGASLRQPRVHPNLDRRRRASDAADANGVVDASRPAVLRGLALGRYPPSALLETGECGTSGALTLAQAAEAHRGLRGPPLDRRERGRVES